MAQFIMLTQGGNHPNTPEDGQAFMAKWKAWSDGVEMVTAPTPCGGAEVIGGEFGSDLMNGYIVFEAADRDAARKVVEACPHLGLGGTIQLAEVGKMPG